MAIKIGWAHDYALADRFGGAQLTNETMIEHAPPWAQVVRCYPGRVVKADFYILNNCKFFAEFELVAMMSRPFAKFEHDHWDCPQAWQKPYIRRALEGARGWVFLSPLHAESFQEKHGTPAEYTIVPSPVDPSDFYPDKRKRGIVWLGEYASHKGVREAVAWAEDHKTVVSFFGWGHEPPRGPWVIDGGQLPYPLIPATLGEAQALLFLPVWPEAFGRVVAEAIFSGCEIIGNENIGALSWGLDREGLAAACYDAPSRFWNAIKGWL